MTPKHLRDLADSLELGFMTQKDRHSWVRDLRAFAKDVERSVLVEPGLIKGMAATASATDQLYDLALDLLQKGILYRSLIAALKDAHAEQLNREMDAIAMDEGEANG